MTSASRRVLDTKRPNPWPAADLLGPAVTYKRGTVIAEAASPVRRLFLIERGVVGRIVRGVDRDVLDSVRTVGWLIGAVSALTGGRYEARVVAVSECQLRPLDVEPFATALERQDVSRWLNLVLAADIRAAVVRTSALAERRIRPLIENLLVDLMSAAGRKTDEGSVRLTFDLSVSDVATLVGASREHTSRVLSELEDQAVMMRVRGWFTIPAESPLLRQVAVEDGHVSRDAASRVRPHHGRED